MPCCTPRVPARHKAQAPGPDAPASQSRTLVMTSTLTVADPTRPQNIICNRCQRVVSLRRTISFISSLSCLPGGERDIKGQIFVRLPRRRMQSSCLESSPQLRCGHGCGSTAASGSRFERRDKCLALLNTEKNHCLGPVNKGGDQEDSNWPVPENRTLSD